MENDCSLRTLTYRGLEALELSNGKVKLVIVPELGGKITSIQDMRTGREWLWTNPHLPVKPVAYDASFVEKYDTGGLDECFPAVSGGHYPSAPWDGVQIPDHGELWCQPWQAEIVKASGMMIKLAMSCRGARFPYLFERRLLMSSAGKGIRLEYRLQNQSNFDFPFIWCIHPILKIEAGMKVHLPAGIGEVRVDSGTGDFAGLAGSRVAWPSIDIGDEQLTDLSRLPAKTFGQAVKLYTHPLKGEEMVETAVLEPSGDHGFAFRFRPDEISHVGLWMNLGGWSGTGSAPYFNLGLEPAIGGTDSLADAVKMKEYAILPAGGERRWHLEMVVT